MSKQPTSKYEVVITTWDENKARWGVDLSYVGWRELPLLFGINGLAPRIRIVIFGWSLLIGKLPPKPTTTRTEIAQ